MKIANIIGIIVGIAGMALTITNFNLQYAEGPPGVGGIYKHDNVGNVFKLLSILFFVMTGIFGVNLYLMKSKGSTRL